LGEKADGLFGKIESAAENRQRQDHDMIESEAHCRITAEKTANAEAQKKIGGIVSAQYEDGESFPPEIIELAADSAEPRGH
jgi:PDZ domain-containing secreted protein